MRSFDHKSRGWAAPIVAFTIMTSACSSAAQHSTRVATAGGATTTTPSSASYDQDFIDFAHCMRDHGIADFPDPVQRVGHDGLSLSFPDGLDVSTGVGKAANDACQRIIQPVINMKQSSAVSGLTPEKMQALLAYSHCMRDHQIPLLDPDSRDGHISTGAVAGLVDPPLGRRDPLFAAADAACRNLLPADVADDGTGPP